MNYLKVLRGSAYLLLGLFVAACGGGGSGGGGGSLSYTGLTTPAAITADNAGTIGTSTTDAATQAISADTNSTNNPFAVVVSGGTPTTINEQTAKIVRDVITTLQQAPSLPVGVTYSYTDLNAQIVQAGGTAIFCGGSLSGPNDPNATSGTITFNNLCVDLGTGGMAYLNGSVTFSYTESSDGSWTQTDSYSNFSITVGGETFTISGTEKCSYTASTGAYSCSELYTGADGKTYEVADASVTGDATSGYYVSATVSLPDYGVVTITTSASDPILYGCSNGYPSSGTIMFSSTDGSSGSITFRSDCTGYDGTYITSGGASSGTFSGNWPA